jgi:CubicO group peptidase (beta-lactamase class C family)
MRTKRVSISGCCVLLLTFCGLASAERLVDPQELEQWADEYYGRAVQERRSPGVTVSVVQDGEIILAKGYGYADYGERVPVDPQRSGFVVGSITKTFIATAIGQLIDRGAIGSFHDPVNRYLKRVQLPGERGARVTIQHLLTHRAGFEDVEFGMGDPSGRSAVLPLSGQEILRFMPQLVMEPGGPAVYSNWGFSLLGFLIEDVTGQRIDAYLKENIWEPLGMSGTGMIYGAFPENLSRSYWFEKDGTAVMQPQDLPHPWIGPAGTIVSTAVDMARYMNAHMLQGENDTYALVSKEMFRRLHTENFRNALIFNGFAQAFWTDTLNGASTIEHGGGAPGFQSMMVMIPDKRLGFFVSAMQGGPAPWAGASGSGGAAAGKPPTGFALRESFIDRFLQRPPEWTGGRPVDPSKLVGTYWTQLRAYTTVEALAQAFNPGAVLRVDLADGQGLLVNGAGPYTSLGDGVFASPTRGNKWIDPYAIDFFLPAYLAFNLDGDGAPVNFVAGGMTDVWRPASPIFNPHAMRTGFVLFGAIVLSGLSLFAWPQRRRLASPANYLAVCLALAVIAFPYAIVGGFAQGDSFFNQMALADKTRLWVMVGVANLMVVLTAAFVFSAFKECSRGGAESGPGWARWGRRLHLGCVGVSSIAVLIALGFFKLLGVHLPG